MTTNQYKPLPAEYVVTGIIGVLVYGLIIVHSVLSVRHGIKSQSTRRFFLCVVLMACLEVPRFLVMAVQGSYSSKVAYSFHILAGVFFFAAFSIVCRQWSGLLQLGSYFRVVYGLYGLIASNLCFMLVDAAAMAICCSSASLGSFFSSPEFEVVTFIEGVRNCVYSSFLSYYGIKLVRRFWQFSRIERQSPMHKGRSCLSFACPWWCGDRASAASLATHQEAVFTRVVMRMTSVLILSSVCFLCRISMLIAKMVAVHSSQPITAPTFALFGFLWFCLSDFIPRAAPTLAFIFLMSTKRPTKEIRSTASHKHRLDDSDDFQFVHLPVSDGVSSHDSYFDGAHSRTELMLKADFLVESPIHEVAGQKSTTLVSVPGASDPSYTSMSQLSSTHDDTRSFRNPKQPGYYDGDGASSSSSDDDDDDRGLYWPATENRVMDGLFSMLYFKSALPSNGSAKGNVNDTAVTFNRSDSTDDIHV